MTTKRILTNLQIQVLFFMQLSVQFQIHINKFLQFISRLPRLRRRVDGEGVLKTSTDAHSTSTSSIAASHHVTSQQVHLMAQEIHPLSRCLGHGIAYSTSHLNQLSAPKRTLPIAKQRFVFCQ